MYADGSAFRGRAVRLEIKLNEVSQHYRDRRQGMTLTAQVQRKYGDLDKG